MAKTATKKVVRSARSAYDLSYVADIARELVHETINRLDSVELDYPERRPRGR